MKHQLEGISNVEQQAKLKQYMMAGSINGGQIATAGVTAIFGKLEEKDHKPTVTRQVIKIKRAFDLSSDTT